MNQIKVVPIQTKLILRVKAAISNHRITVVDEQQVIFTYKDYRDGATTKTMTLCNKDFIQRCTARTTAPLCTHQALRHC